MSETVDSLPEEQPEMDSPIEEQLELNQAEEVEEHEYNFDDVLNEAVEGIDEEDEEPTQPEVEPEPEEQPVVESTPEPEPQTLNPELEEQRKNMQADYTRKMQELAELRKQTEPFAVLNSQMQNNPELLQQVIGLTAQQNAPQAPQEAPDDPIEAIKYEAQQAAQKSQQEALAPIVKQMQAMEHQNAINNTLSSVKQDPLFNDTHKAMAEYVQGEYATLHGVEAAKALYQRLDTDVNAFKQLYGSFRAKVEGSKTSIAKPVLGKQKTNAPNISTDQGVPVVPKPRATRRKQSDLAKRAMNSGSRSAAVDYFESTGMFDKFK